LPRRLAFSNKPKVGIGSLRLITLRERRPMLQQRLIGQSMSAAELRDLLLAAGCPTTPEEIGLDRAHVKACYAQARQIRSRYTIFDLAAEAGCLPDCVEQLFDPGGFWLEA
jgi:glycerol-1-phosphate dehydrogenase [NAD(P)+]